MQMFTYDNWTDVPASKRTAIREYFHKMYIQLLDPEELPSGEKHVKHFMAMAKTATLRHYPEDGPDVELEITKIAKFQCEKRQIILVKAHECFVSPLNVFLSFSP
jgi:hypothetical protein